MTRARLCNPPGRRVRAVDDFDWGEPGDSSPKTCAGYGGFNASQLAVALPDPRRNCRIDPLAARRSDGFFGDVGPITVASISDGLSQTLIVADKATTPLRGLDDPADPHLIDHVGWWVAGDLGQTLLTGAFPPNVVRRRPPGGLSHTAAWSWSAASLHPGGVNGLLADGSVRFLSDSIDASPLDPDELALIAGAAPGVWQKLITRNGAEVVGANEF